jgi:hypothetical protein
MDFPILSFQVLLLNFITKLEKNQLDTWCHPPAGFSRGLAAYIGKGVLFMKNCCYRVVKRACGIVDQARIVKRYYFEVTILLPFKWYPRVI